MYLGVDGGGTKTAFLMLSPEGLPVATAAGGSAYHPEVGLDGVRNVIRDGVLAVLAAAGVEAGAITHAFFGIPAYGEDQRADVELARMPLALLRAEQYTCGNDMICSWAGSLACTEGISIIAGTGSISYGEYDGRRARAGGWGEVFGDEGSAYWIAREGLAAFARMSDGRSPEGPLLALLRNHYALTQDLDLAGRINALSLSQRSSIAQLSQIVAEAASAGDAQAGDIYRRAGIELAALVAATRRGLRVPAGELLPVSYSGGVFKTGPQMLAPFAAALAATGDGYRLAEPLLTPVAGAAIYAARCVGRRFEPQVLKALANA
jgi:N-acetylglucosamine kinase-like BadF-type ATPase